MTVHPSTGEVRRWIADHDPLPLAHWSDPLVEELGYPVTSSYVEMFWLPIIGPSALVTVRRLAGHLHASHLARVNLPLVELAGTVGLGDKQGADCPMVRTLARLTRFAIARPVGDRAGLHPPAFEVRTYLSPLTLSLAEKLPSTLRAMHERVVAQANIAPVPAPAPTRGGGR